MASSCAMLIRRCHRGWNTKSLPSARALVPYFFRFEDGASTTKIRSKALLCSAPHLAFGSRTSALTPESAANHDVSADLLAKRALTDRARTSCKIGKFLIQAPGGAAQMSNVPSLFELGGWLLD